MKALVKSANFGISMLLILAAIAIAYIAIPAFGNKALIVRSGSMQPAIGVGDLVVVQTKHGLLTPQPISANPLSSAKISLYKEGDVIAFKSQNDSKLFTTHRIVAKEVKDGKVFYQTKGDANNAPDQNLVAQDYVIGKSIIRLPYFGKLFAFAKSNIGFPLLVIFPALLVIILEIVNIYKEIKRQNRLIEIPMPKENFAGLKIIIPVFLSVMVMHNAFAYFSDTETSTGNIFQAAESFCEPTTEGSPFWASGVDSSSQGARKDGSPVLSERSISASVLGPGPSFTTNPDSGFFSLGQGGSIIVHFPSALADVPGNDIAVYEVTNGRLSYPLEEAKVEVSFDGTTWNQIGTISSQSDGTGIGEVNLTSAYSGAKFVKLTDITNYTPHASNADGYDIDAIRANALCASTSPSASPTPGPGSVVINEINWAGNNSSSTDEWIELRNTTSAPIDISGWVIENLGDSATPNYTIPSSTTISANGLLLISHYSETTSKINVPPDLLYPSISLSNDGEQLVLKNASSIVIDTANIVGAWFEGDNSTPKKSMERKSPPGDGSVSTNWQTATTHTNMDGSGSEDEFGTPKAENGT